MLEFTALAFWLTLLIAPDTPIGRALHHWMVAIPARRLDRIGRGHVLLALLLLAAVSVVIWIMEQEGILLMSMAAPELAAFLTTVEISAYLDVVAALAITASSVRLRSIVTRFRTGIGRAIRSSPRTTRERKTARRTRPYAANDDGDQPEHAIAA